MDSNISIEKGIAPIKNEYLATKVEIKFDPNCMSGSNKINENDDKEDDQNKRKNDSSNNENESKSYYKNNKKKMRGTNQNRRNEMRKKNFKTLESKDRFCRAYCRENKCQFGDKCTFSHDLDLYTSQYRLDDIDDICPNFQTFGKCDYGILCRFGRSHLKDGKFNVIDEDKYLKASQTDKISNILSKDLQISLRKKQYDFKLANTISGQVSSEKIKIIDAKKEKPNQLKKKIDFNNKLYLAPLTTLGNLPFRRICKEFGADITCGEMALCTNILEGSNSEWALLRRHSSEDIFGVQICGASVDQLTRCAQLINQECDVDFIDLNMGCPIDLIYRKGAGSALMERKKKLDQIIYSVSTVSNIPLTLKMRTGVYNGKNIAKDIIGAVREWQNDRIGLVTVHGRSREQRYTKSADWDYIKECAWEATKPLNDLDPIPIFGSGDIISQEEYFEKLNYSNVNGIMIGRGALMKPWIFTEIKEKRTWDITATERLEILRKFVNYGLCYWGSDSEGVEKTRRFLLDWLSFLYRYIPVGLLERLPQKINERPPRYFGRNDLETLMSSPSCNDWISISEMFLGKVPEGFTFIPKHKANSY